MTMALVTGASGFIGGHLAEALVGRGYQVRCLVRKTSRTEHLRRLDVELVSADLQDQEGLRRAVAGADLVFHVAGLTTAPRVRDLMQVNAEGVEHLMQACAARQTPPVLVLVSSVAASGPTVRGRLRREQDPPSPVSHYGRSKRAGELVARKWARAIPTTVVRPGIVFGPRNRELLPVFQSIARMRVHLVPGWVLPPLSLIHVADLVEILLRAAGRGQRLEPYLPGDSGSGRGCYFACAAEYPDYLQFGRLISAALGKRHVMPLHIVHPIPWLIGSANQLVGRLRGRREHLSVDKLREATADSWACSAAAVCSSLGFSPPLKLASRLRENVQWYREQGWL